VVEGDDLLGVVDGSVKEAKLAQQKYEDMGFRIKFEMFDSISNASFCGLVFDPQDQNSICDPLKLLLNFGWVSARYENASVKTRKELLRAKALSVLHKYPGVPIVVSFGKYILRCTAGYRYKLPGEWTEWMKKQFSSNWFERSIGQGTRMLMEKIHGFSVSEQYELERYFDELDELKPIEHPLLSNHFTGHQLDYWNRFVRDPVKSREYVTAAVPSISFFEILEKLGYLESRCLEGGKLEDKERKRILDVLRQNVRPLDNNPDLQGFQQYQ